jgi:hypothetical protein
MKKCKSCHAEIPDKAKKCSHCGTDQRGWFRRHPILTALGVIIVFFIVIGVAVELARGRNQIFSSLFKTYKQLKNLVLIDYNEKIISSDKE